MWKKLLKNRFPNKILVRSTLEDLTMRKGRPRIDGRRGAVDNFWIVHRARRPPRRGPLRRRLAGNDPGKAGGEGGFS